MATIAFDSLLPVIGNTATITPDSATGPVLADQLARTTNRAPITIRNATRTVTDGIVTVTGQAGFLNVHNAPVTVIAREAPDGTVALIARFALIDGTPDTPPWKFSRSFPTLPPFAAGQRFDKLNPPKGPLPNTLDTLDLADAAFVLCTVDHATDPVTRAPLQAGLNFVARQKLTGALGLIEKVAAGGERIPLYGRIVIPMSTEAAAPLPAQYQFRLPWQLPEQPPGILLRADLPLDVKVSSALRIHGVCERIYCPTDAAWAEANPGVPPYLAVSADLDIPSAQITVELTALGLSEQALSFIGTGDGVSLRKLEDLADLAGGTDLAALLPDDVRSAVRALEALELQSVSLDLGPGLKPLSAGTSVGLAHLQTKVLPGFEIDNLVAGFAVGDPFGSDRNVSLLLGGQMRFAGTPVDVAVELPSVTASARAVGTINVPLSTFTKAIHLPAPDMLPDLPVNQLQMEIAADGSFAVYTGLAEQPPWTLDLGPSRLTVKDLTLSIFHIAGQPSMGQVSGSIAFGDLFTLQARYFTPGQFTMTATLPEVSLRGLIDHLTNQDVPIPPGFDLTLEDSSVVIQKGAGNALVFQLATTVRDVGTMAFEARRVGGASWGFAAGIDLAGGRLSKLPGLSALEPFENVFQLDQLVVVASSFEDPSFKFPELASFSSPTLASTTFAMPAGGVTAGFNVSAEWTLDSSREQRLLQKFLSLPERLDVTLQVGKEPAEDSRLFASFGTAIAHMPFTCRFGGALQGSQVELFLKGTLSTRIQGRPVAFEVEMDLVENGAFFSGSMLGSIAFEGLTLSNVALVIGCDWEGIPSLGVAGTLSAVRFNSALAIFFDANDPSRSMLAGAVSDLTLKDVVTTLALSPMPRELDTILSEVGLLHTSEFTIDGALADALDNLQLDPVAAAFATHGVPLSTSVRDVLVVTGEKGKKWFISNLLDRMMHYELTRSGDTIQVMLNPQLYCVPQAASLGALKFEQGFFVTGRLQVLSFDAQVKVSVSRSKGILVDGTMDKIVVGNDALFSVTSAEDPNRGPSISVATFTQPEISDPVVRGPHFVIDGMISLLRLQRHAYVMVSEQGFRFDIGGDVLPGLDVNLHGHFSNLHDFSAGGTMNIGVGNIDLGVLGQVAIATGVHAALDAGYDGKRVTAKVGGAFELANKKFTIRAFDLDPGQGLPGLPRRIRDEVTKLLRQYFEDPAQWADMVGRGAVTGVKDMAATLKKVFGVKTAEEAARLMRQARQSASTVVAGLKRAYGASDEEAVKAMLGAGYVVDELAEGLKGLGLSAAQTATLLKSAGLTAAEVAGALRPVYKADSNAIAKWLRAAGYSAGDVKSALQSVYHASSDAIRKALDTAGFASGEINRIFGKTGDTIKHITDKFNPFHW